MGFALLRIVEVDEAVGPKLWPRTRLMKCHTERRHD